MKLTISDISQEDPKYTELAYKSIFYNRNEFEYIRMPPLFLQRYREEEEYDIKCASIDNKAVATLGIIYYVGFLDGVQHKIGVFVDNCILPEYLKDYELIFGELFKEIEKNAIRRKADFVIGWDYQKKTDEKKDFFLELGFNILPGFNWFPGGSDLNWSFSKMREFNLSLTWKIGLRTYYIKHKFFELKAPKVKGILVNQYKKNELQDIAKFLNRQNEKVLFSQRYTAESLQKNIKKYELRVAVAKINGTIEGVLVYFASSWSGLMVGKPGYTKNWGHFLSWTPIEFAVHNDNSAIATNLLFWILHRKGVKSEIKNTNYTFAVELFDRRMGWKRKAYADAGLMEPTYDFGVLLIKKIGKMTPDLSKPVYVPNNLIVSPFLFRNISKTEKDNYL